jgi:hypothetical protein
MGVYWISIDWKRPMATETRTAQLSVRLYERDKAAFAVAAERCGMDASVAGRVLVEMVVQRLAQGGDFIDALHELKRTWGVPKEPATPAPTPPKKFQRI